jgi:putative colanic acid biosynthesis acetyltransferase WcaF
MSKGEFVDLSTYDNSWYSPGRSRWVQALWFFIGLPLLRSTWIPSSGFRRWLLRAFGCLIGEGVVIKPGVRVKYPWLIEIGDHTWIGEDVWIDNIGSVQIGSNVCISQAAYLCTGNHDWTDPSFALLIGPIILRDGAWVGARCLIGPGVEMAECSVAGAGSVVTGKLRAFTVYAGNPAVAVRPRNFKVPEPLRSTKAVPRSDT